MAKTQAINHKKIVARASMVQTSPRKLRRIANAVRGIKPMRAIELLQAMPQRAAINLLKVYQQAVGNAKNNFQMSPDSLKVVTLQIEEGPHGPKRMDIHAHGARYDRGVRRKRLAHIRLELIEEPKEQSGTKS